MTAHTTGTITSRDGTSLAYAAWVPAQPMWCALVAVQGRGEHTGRYEATATALAAAGIGVWMVDLRGQGRSGGRRGDVPSWRSFLQDVAACEALARREAPNVPVALLGHSLGGLIALHYAVEQQGRLAALILSSPLCGLARPVPAWEDWLALHIFSRWWPTFPFTRAGSDAQFLSHVPTVATAFLHDPLVHFRVTARLYREITLAMSRAVQLAPQLTLPTLVLQAGEDRIVSSTAAKQWTERVGATDKTYREYDGFYHELFNEVDAARVVGDMVAWLRPRVTRR